MIEFINKLLSKLTECNTVSGFEIQSEEKLKELLLPYFDSFKMTRAGNYIFTKNCKFKNTKTVLIDTHIDEIGLMVTEICDGGFLKFTTVGGIDTRILSACDVKVCADKPFRGIVTSRAPHLMSAKEASSNPDTDNLCIDTGLDTDYLKENVPLGTPVKFNYPYTRLLNNKVTSPGLDNKACVCAAVTAIKLLEEENLPFNIVLMLSSREEIGASIAATGAYEIMPSKAFILDVNFAYLPEDPAADTKNLRHTAILGEGPVLSLSAVTNRTLTRELIKTADENDIKLSLICEASSTGTNNDRLALVNAGIPSAVLGIPLQNMHTYSEVASLNDIENCAKLLCAYLRKDSV